MLVIARRENEKFVFPNLGISIQVVKVAGNVARIGIDAPREIRVLREELVDENTDLSTNGLPKELENIASFLPEKLKHDFRNRLNPIALGLQIAQKQIEKGKIKDLEKVVQKLIQQLKSLDRDLVGESAGTQTPTERLLGAIEDHQGDDDARLALIVDDDENERSLLGSLLELSGYNVVVVEDGQAAIDYLQQSFRQPDFVLLDMNMPRKSGPETISEIRSNPRLKDLKVFAVSGSDQQELKVDVGPQGVDCWFTKPLDARQLVGEMNRQSESQSA